MKKTISVLIAIAMLMTSVSTAFASTFSDYTDKNLAIVAAGLVSMHSSMTVDGSVYSAGEIRFDGSGGNKVNGSLISPTKNGYTHLDKKGNALNAWATKPSISGDLVTDSSAAYTENVVSPLFNIPMLPKAKAYDTVEANGWWGNGTSILYQWTINSDTTVKKLTVNGPGLIVDLSKGDVNLVVDQLTMTSTSSTISFINTSGNNHVLNLYVKDWNVTGSTINAGGDSNRMNLYINGDVQLKNSYNICANAFINGDSVTISGSSKVDGALVTNASNVTVTGGGATVNGVLYAPNASCVVASSGKVQGQLVANSVEIYGSSSITYNESEIRDFENNIKGNISKIEGTDKPVVSDPYVNDLIPSNNPTTENLVGKLTNDAAYLYGKSDTNMSPEEPIIRCEASALLYRLLKQNHQLSGYTKPAKPSFDDLTKNVWYYNGLEFMTYLGVYNSNVSYISPYQEITRGEAAKMFNFALGLSETENVCQFSDLSTSDRYYKYINAMVAGGYMSGDEGKNTIRPNDVLTRAEFVVIYNRIIGRDDTYNITTDVNGNEVSCPFTDMDSSDWYYDDLMRATNAFTNGKVDASKRANRDDLDD